MLDKNENKQDWENKMRRVAWFDNMISFYQAWNKIPHSNATEILYNTNENVFKM